MFLGSLTRPSVDLSLGTLKKFGLILPFAHSSTLLPDNGASWNAEILIGLRKPVVFEIVFSHSVVEHKSRVKRPMNCNFFATARLKNKYFGSINGSKSSSG